jgi:hypothetical protein
MNRSRMCRLAHRRERSYKEIKKFFPEVGEPAVRMVPSPGDGIHRCGDAVKAIAPKLAMHTASTERLDAQHEVESGQRGGVISEGEGQL